MAFVPANHRQTNDARAKKPVPLKVLLVCHEAISPISTLSSPSLSKQVKRMSNNNQLGFSIVLLPLRPKQMSKKEDLSADKAGIANELAHLARNLVGPRRCVTVSTVTSHSSYFNIAFRRTNQEWFCESLSPQFPFSNYRRPNPLS